MKRNSSIPQDYEIHLREIIIKIWNNKILILSISFFFLVAGYVYGALQSKIYKAEITLRDAPTSLFEPYRTFLSTDQQTIYMTEQTINQYSIAKQFNDELKLNLSSFSNLIEFYKKNNEINDFKNHLKEKNISIEKYFQPRISRYKFEAVSDASKLIYNKYSLTYSQPLPGDAFLKDYIIFTQQKTIDAFKKKLITVILNDINIHNENLEIAKIINLENPILGTTSNDRDATRFREHLFYNGTKVITQKIFYLNKLLNQTKNSTFVYDPILDQSSITILMEGYSQIFALLGLLLGFLFSCIVIFLKNVLK